MDKNFISVFYQKIHISLIAISCVVISLYAFNYEGVTYERFIDILPNNSLLRLTYIIGFFVVILGFVLSIYYEIKLDEIERNEQMDLYQSVEQELKELSQQVPYKITSSSFYNKVKSYCDNSWKMGDTKEYMAYANLQKELLDYALRMKDSETTVSWREEMSFVNKLIDLMKLCHRTSTLKIELFEISANYRFPIGLFVIPLFDAIEWSINTVDSSLHVECSSKGGLWNCRIVSHSTLSERINKGLRTHGFYDLKKRVDAGNWPIKVEKAFEPESTEVTIIGRYAF